MKRKKGCVVVVTRNPREEGVSRRRELSSYEILLTSPEDEVWEFTFAFSDVEVFETLLGGKKENPIAVSSRVNGSSLFW